MKNLKERIIKRKEFTPGACVYEDELVELEKVIKILYKEEVETRLINGKEMKFFRITIPTKDKDLFVSIMRDGYLNIRKR